MATQGYATAPGRNTAVASGPPMKGLIAGEMGMTKQNKEMKKMKQAAVKSTKKTKKGKKK
jgi:hypothetical protein